MSTNLAPPSLRLIIPPRFRLIAVVVAAVLVVLLVAFAAMKVYDRITTPEYPDAKVQDWATFADHLVVGRATGDDTFLVTTVLWTRQGAHHAPRRIIWRNAPDLEKEHTYALPITWVTGHGPDHWSPLNGDSILPLSDGVVGKDASDRTWAGKHVGDRPQELAAELYDKGPYAAAVPHLYESVDARVEAVQ